MTCHHENLSGFTVWTCGRGASERPSNPGQSRTVPTRFPVGTRVKHAMFGAGEVMKVECPSGDGHVVTVQFADRERTLVDSFLKGEEDFHAAS